MESELYQTSLNLFESLFNFSKSLGYRILLPGALALLIGQLTWFSYEKQRLKWKLRQKQQNLEASMNTLKHRLDDVNINLDVTQYDLSEIQHMLRSKQLEPVDLLHSYQAKALQLYVGGNSGICEFIAEAEQQALDLAVSPTRYSSPLYGIPISLNEPCAIKGYDSTFGLIKYCNNPNVEDCVLVKVLKSLGAVPFVLTTTTQANLHLTGYSSIFADCSNPHSSDHEPGGSASGEGVLLGLRGSPIGMATDVGGSVRVTASFCGLVGLKPTSYRISNRGLAKLTPAHNQLIRTCVGPLGRKTKDLAILMQAILGSGMSDLDPKVPPLGFNQTVYEGLDKPKLRIGFYETLDSPDLIQSVPSVRRAIREAVQILTGMGHHVVQFEPPRPAEAFHLALKLLNAHGTKVSKSRLYAEPLNKDTSHINMALGLPHFVRLICDSITRRIFGKPAALAHLLSGPRNLPNTLKLLDDVQRYVDEFQQEWDKTGCPDVIICPVQANPVPHKSAETRVVGPSNVYAVLYNLIDYPAGTVCVSTVNEDDIRKSKELYDCAMTPLERSILKLQETTQGLPLGVQVVAKPFKEEMVLRVMRELESHNSDQR